MKPTAESVPYRSWVVVLLGVCLLVTAVFAVNTFAGRQEFPVWFWLPFQIGTTLLAALIICYLVALLHHRPPKFPKPCWALGIWLCLVASVICTSSLHGFFPFRPGVATVWKSFPPALKFIKYNYLLTAGSFVATVALAVLFFYRRRRLALVGLLLLSGIMLIPNDDCPNALNLPWIAWIGASPLMFLCNSVVLLVGYCALSGRWPRMSVLVMGGINIWVLVLGLGHTAQFDLEVNQRARERNRERQRQRPPIVALSRIPIEGHASFYVCSDASLGFEERLPAVICIGHAFQQPETLLQLVGKFSEPVLLIWSDLLSDLSADTTLEDAAVWEKKRHEFAEVLDRCQAVLHFDERRVYLTGFAFAGAYAWMLAYDRPEVYAGVVPMSAMSYPEPIQQRLDSGKSVVTVVVRGEEDPFFQNHYDQEMRTGRAVEARNPHSKFIVKPGEGKRENAKHWVESLRYILQFRLERNHAL